MKILISVGILERHTSLKCTVAHPLHNLWYIELVEKHPDASKLHTTSSKPSPGRRCSISRDGLSQSITFDVPKVLRKPIFQLESTHASLNLYICVCTNRKQRWVFLTKRASTLPCVSPEQGQPAIFYSKGCPKFEKMLDLIQAILDQGVFTGSGRKKIPIRDVLHPNEIRPVLLLIIA
jgi:hypothetical protein